MSHALPDILMMLTIYDHHANDALLLGHDAHSDTCDLLTTILLQQNVQFCKTLLCDKTLMVTFGVFCLWDVVCVT